MYCYFNQLYSNPSKKRYQRYQFQYFNDLASQNMSKYWKIFLPIKISNWKIIQIKISQNKQKIINFNLKSYFAQRKTLPCLKTLIINNQAQIVQLFSKNQYILLVKLTKDSYEDRIWLKIANLFVLLKISKENMSKGQFKYALKPKIKKYSHNQHTQNEYFLNLCIKCLNQLYPNTKYQHHIKLLKNIFGIQNGDFLMQKSRVNNYGAKSRKIIKLKVYTLTFYSSYNKNKMKASKSNIKSRNRIGKAKYKKYNFEQRQALIKLVVIDGWPLASSAKDLGICQTTARLIISTWNQQKRVFEKKTDREKRLFRQRRKQKKMELKQKLNKSKSKKSQEKSQDGAAEALNIKEENEIAEIQPITPVGFSVENEEIPIMQSLDAFNYYLLPQPANFFGLPYLYFMPNIPTPY